MSNIKISNLGQAGALTGTELLPIVQNNETVRTTLNQVKSFAGIAISNNIIGDAASTTIAPSVNAIKTYTDGLVVGLLNDRGNYTPSVTSPGAYPSSGGSGTGGAIQKGDIWFINGNGYLGTTAVIIGASVRALVSSPSPTTDSDWDILDAGLIQATLQSVLNAGFTASDSGGGINIITLTNSSGTTYSTLGKNFLNFYAPTKSSVYNVDGFDVVDVSGDYINGSVDRLKVYDVTTNNSTELKYDSLKYNNSAFVGSLETATLTSSQTWTLPNATGTLALTTNVWNATGNAGTVAGTNFIGTTDAIDFVAKTNNTERLRVLSTGQVKLSSLTGTGTRMVVANSVGQLATQTITSPTLQTVTNAGNTTTNDIISYSLSSSITAQSSIDSASATLNAVGGETGYLILTTATGLVSTLSPLALTGSRTYNLPDNDGTIALLSDINTSNSWKTIGNAGTDPLTDFIGTTDNVDLVFKVNNTERLRIDSTYGSVIATDSFRAIGVDTSVQAYSNSGNGGVIIAQDSTTKGYIFMSNGTGDSQIQCTNLTTSGRILELPDASGTIALTNTVTLQNVLAGTNKNLTSGINLQGTNAGGGTFSGTNINAFGTNAAQNNSGSYVNALGQSSAGGNSGDRVNAFGFGAANDNSGNDVNAFGNVAAETNSGNDVNAFGATAAVGNTGNNVNAFGYGAGQNNTIGGATIFSNASLPSYADYTAASAAITVVLGGTAGCTYLYHDQATNSIGAVRL